MKIRIETLVFVVLIVSQFEVSCFPLNLNKLEQIANNTINAFKKNDIAIDASLTNKYNVLYNAYEDKVELQKNNELEKSIEANEKEFMQILNGVEEDENIGKGFTF